MTKYNILQIIGYFFCSINLFSQNENHTFLTDSLYREDQFYAAVAYNLLDKKPNNVSQSGFSPTVNLGFIRDIPINSRRNLALGIGLGLSYSSYNQNILIYKDEENRFNYQVLSNDDVSYTKNKFSTYAIELPIEFRWRTSSVEVHKFWRVYPGFKMYYTAINNSKHRNNIASISTSNNPDYNHLQYGLTFSVGFGVWNFHVYYGLNTIFKDTATIDHIPIEMKPIKIGLMFYIL